MSSPDVRGPGTGKPPPACRGKGRCRVPACPYHNPNARFSADMNNDDHDDVSLEQSEGVDGPMLGADPSVQFAPGG